MPANSCCSCESGHSLLAATMLIPCYLYLYLHLYLYLSLLLVDLAVDLNPLCPMQAVEDRREAGTKVEAHINSIWDQIRHVENSLSQRLTLAEASQVRMAACVLC